MSTCIFLIRIRCPVSVYLLGGGNLILRGVKDSTKDVDFIVDDRQTFVALAESLQGLNPRSTVTWKRRTTSLIPVLSWRRTGVRAGIFSWRRSSASRPLGEGPVGGAKPPTSVSVVQQTVPKPLDNRTELWRVPALVATLSQGPCPAYTQLSQRHTPHHVECFP